MKNFAFLLSFFGFLCLCFADVQIDPGRAVILSPDPQTPAAQELKLHLELITGKTIPVISCADEADKGTYVFYVGRVPDGEDSSFCPEEARWFVTPDAAYFYGDKRNGARNAVYDFLENELGVRWPAPGKIYVRKQETLTVRNPRGVWCPGLKIRSIRMNKGNPDVRQWRARLRFGAHDQPSFGHAFTRYWERFGKTHPEYFAMREDGVRGPADLPGAAANPAAYRGRADRSVAMCVSNDDLVKQVISDWNKKSEYINICENDAGGRDSCHCPACSALDVPREKLWWEENTHADRYVHFANRVLEEAQKVRPDVKVCFYAYNASEEAPQRELLAENLVVGFAPSVYSMNALYGLLEAWKEAGLKHFFYRPNRHHFFNIHQLPCGSEKYFFDVFQYFRRSGAFGFDYDSPPPLSPPQFFSDYVIAKGMQDPSRPFEFWEEHYLQSYGNAADEVREYFRYWRKNVWDTRLCPQMDKIMSAGRWYNFARGLVRDIRKCYRVDDFDITDRILDRALEKPLNESERTSVEELKTFNTHARLFFLATSKQDTENSIRLLKFREAHGFPAIPENEAYWGDNCGIGLAREFQDFAPPHIRLPLLWSFRLDPRDEGVKEQWFAADRETVRKWGDFMSTDGPWENPVDHSGLPAAATRAKTADYDGIAWYGTGIRIPADWQNRQIYLYFGAVDESCHVYINGKEAGHHLFEKPDDWKTSFTIPVDKSLINWNGETTVIVRVEDKNGSGGIWKPVWLVSRSERPAENI